MAKPITIQVGQQFVATIAYLDQAGNPLTGIMPDTGWPVTWASNPSAAGIDRLIPSADTRTCTVQALAVGTDTITLGVTVGGAIYNDSILVTILPMVPTLTKAAIAPAQPTQITP